MSTMKPRLIALLLATALIAGACGAGDDDATSAEAEATEAEATAGLRQVSATESAELIANGADDLIILDIRTPDEFNEGHLEGAIIIDFYDADFVDQLAALDPNAEYVLYCNSGNRSGATMPVLEELGFTNVAEMGGGIQAWYGAALPVVTG